MLEEYSEAQQATRRMVRDFAHKEIARVDMSLNVDGLYGRMPRLPLLSRRAGGHHRRRHDSDPETHHRPRTGLFPIGEL